MSTRPPRARTIGKSTRPVIAGALALALGAIASPAWSQQKPAVTPPVDRAKVDLRTADVRDTTGQRYKSLEELRKAYAGRQEKMEKDRIADLNDLTTRQTGAEAEATYSELFYLAMAQNQYAAAEKAARRYQSLKGGDRRTKSLATLIIIIAHADRGEYDRSLAELETYFKRKGIPEDPADRLDPKTVFALGEAYLNQLTQAGKYDIAKRVCELGAKHPDKEVREHFEKRAKLFDMVGKPAPELVGKDVDGQTIHLADFKGKVVLVDFWATWCPPCIAKLPALAALRQKHQSAGFEILGVNLDSVREDLGGDAKKAMPIVRRFILGNRIGWPNILDDSTAAKAYDVTDIPASFLIDREGIVRGVDFSAPSLDKVVAAELSKKK